MTEPNFLDMLGKALEPMAAGDEGVCLRCALRMLRETYAAGLRDAVEGCGYPPAAEGATRQAAELEALGDAGWEGVQVERRVTDPPTKDCRIELWRGVHELKGHLVGAVVVLQRLAKLSAEYDADPLSKDVLNVEGLRDAAENVLVRMGAKRDERPGDVVDRIAPKW